MTGSYKLTLAENVKLEKSSNDYMNPCCEYCDILLNLVQDEIKSNYNITDVEIGDEDWGWYLTFLKDNYDYNLHLSYDSDKLDSKEFIFYCFVNKLQKKLFFTKKIEIEDESHAFTVKMKVMFSKIGTVREN